MFQGEFSIHLEVGGKWGKTLKEMLEDTLANIYPAFEANVKCQINGHVIKNLLGAKLE